MEASHDPPVDQRAGTRLLLRVLRHGGSRWTVVLATASILLTVAEMLLPAALGRTLDAVLASLDVGTWVAVVAALVFVVTAADALDDLASGTSTARATAWLRRLLVRHVLAVGIQGNRRISGGDLSTRLVGNAAEAGGVPTAAVWTITAVVPPVGATIALALIDPWLCVAVLLALPVLTRLARTFLRDASTLAERYLRVQADIADRLYDAIGGARTIAAAGTTEREIHRVLAPVPELHRHGVDLWRLQARISGQNAVVVPLLEVAILAVAGWLLVRGRISPGELLAAVQYAGLAAGLVSTGSSLTGLAHTRAAAARIAQALAVPPLTYGERTLAPGAGQLELRRVSVQRGGRPVLDRVDLVLRAGESVALVGRSGAGKSVLAAVVARLLDPDEGEVRLDGVGLPELTHAQLRRAVGYAAADPVLVGDTVAEAIALGASESTVAEIDAAARAARAAGFLRRLPRGYQTSPAQAPMSGGETQRVGLARAFLQAERVLVLDDVAANLDTVTEHHIGEVLRTGLSGRTTLVVAHRTATAARSDRVVWLVEGRVHRCAPHAELWGDPSYRALFATQPEDCDVELTDADRPEPPQEPVGPPTATDATR